MEITIFTATKYTMKRILILLIGLLYCSTISAQQYTDQYIKDATAVSIKWLNNLNHKQYDACWTLHSDEAKTANVSLENWEFFINNLMEEFGYLKSRKVTNAFFLSQKTSSCSINEIEYRKIRSLSNHWCFNPYECGCAGDETVSETRIVKKEEISEKEYNAIQEKDEETGMIR